MDSHEDAEDGIPGLDVEGMSVEDLKEKYECVIPGCEEPPAMVSFQVAIFVVDMEDAEAGEKAVQDLGVCAKHIEAGARGAGMFE